MSDGTYKITGGTGYPELANYRIDPERALLFYVGAEGGAPCH